MHIRLKALQFVITFLIKYLLGFLKRRLEFSKTIVSLVQQYGQQWNPIANLSRQKNQMGHEMFDK